MLNPEYRYGGEEGDRGLIGLRKQITDGYRTSGIQKMVFEKRKRLLWIKTQEEITQTLDDWNVRGHRDLDENGDLILLPDLERIERMAIHKNAEDFDLQIMRQLKKLSSLLAACKRIREEDFNFLVHKSTELFSIFHDAFNGRHRNYSWWHESAHILLYFSYLFSTEMNLWLFTERKLIPNLIESIPDLRTETGHPDFGIVTEANHFVLLTLGNLVWHNYQVAADFRRFGIAEALARVSPLTKYEFGISEGVAFLLSTYVREVQNLDQSIDAGIFSVAEECLCLDLIKYGNCMQYTFDAVPNLLRFLGNNAHWERKIQGALLDKLKEFQHELLNPGVPALFEVFTRETVNALQNEGLGSENILLGFVKHDIWGTLSVKLLNEAMKDKATAVKSTLLAAIVDFWRVKLNVLGETALEKMPIQVLELSISLLVSKPTEVVPILDLLHAYMKVGPINDINLLLSKHQCLIPRVLELIDCSSAPRLNCQLVNSALRLLDELAFILTYDQYNGPSAETLFVLSGCHDTALSAVRFFKELGKHCTSMDIESSSFDFVPKNDLILLPTFESLARRILDGLNSRDGHYDGDGDGDHDDNPDHDRRHTY